MNSKIKTIDALLLTASIIGVFGGVIILLLFGPIASGLTGLGVDGLFGLTSIISLFPLAIGIAYMVFGFTLYNWRRSLTIEELREKKTFFLVTGIISLLGVGTAFLLGLILPASLITIFILLLDDNALSSNLTSPRPLMSEVKTEQPINPSPLPVLDDAEENSEENVAPTIQKEPALLSIQEAYALKEDGVITDEDFETIKKSNLEKYL